MATITVRAPEWLRLEKLPSASVAKAASQTFKAGNLVIVSSGLVSDFAGGASAVNLCIADKSASEPEAPSGSPNQGQVEVLLLNDQFFAIMNLTGTFAQTDVGTNYGLTTSGGHVVVNKSDTTNTRVRVLGLIKGAVGDTTVRVKVRFISNTL